MPSVLCFSGQDPSGYSGISADMRALNYLGVGCFPVLTALTVQNESVFSELLPVPAEIITKQLAAIHGTEPPGAVKLGVLGSCEIAKLVASHVEGIEAPVVTDPVFVSSTGFELIGSEALEIYKHDLFPVSTLVTPNAQEASVIAGFRVSNVDEAISACQSIHDMGPKAVLLKGGHLDASRGTDVYFDGSDIHILESGEFGFKARGSGCTYSSLIAGHLSRGADVLQAVKLSKADMVEALRRSCEARSAYLTFNMPGGSA